MQYVFPLNIFLIVYSTLFTYSKDTFFLICDWKHQLFIDHRKINTTQGGSPNETPSPACRQRWFVTAVHFTWTPSPRLWCEWWWDSPPLMKNPTVHPRSTGLFRGANVQQGRRVDMKQYQTCKSRVDSERLSMLSGLFLPFKLEFSYEK